MSRISELYLRVREADEADYGRSIIRIHKASKPPDIRWGDSINISLDRKNWITCKLEPAGDIGIGKIYIGIHLRGLLNKDTIGIEIARVGVPCNFYVRKASFWKAFFYITIGVIVIIAIAFLVSLLVR
jgi:hypothetical protein